MNKLPSLVLLVMTLSAASVSADDHADALAKQVMEASGIKAWRTVKRIQFTFNVGVDGKQIASYRHDWDVVNGNDTVSWDNKSATANVWTSNHGGDRMVAYKRWVNDAYWLLMPLKLMDPGCVRTYLGRRFIEGRSYETIHLRFRNEVGLTSTDQYVLYVDPKYHLVRFWDHIPGPQEKTRGTWEKYKEFGGLNLSTEHQFGNKRIWFSDLSVTQSNP